MYSSFDRDRGDASGARARRAGHARSGAVAAGVALIALGLAAAGSAGAVTPGTTPDPARALVGIASPAISIEHGAELVIALQQQLAQTLAGPGVGTVSLHSGAAAEAETEARGQGCGYVLFLQLQQSHASSIGGFLKKMAPLAGALPGLGALGGHGDVASAMSQVAASAAQQQAMAQMTAAQQSTIRAGDTLTLEYRLLRATDATVVHSERLQAKAKSDGEDVVGPLVAQVASGVTGSIGGSATSDAARRDSGTDGGAAGPSGSKETQGQKHGLGAVFRGVFGGGTPPPSPGANPQTVDCESIARMPGSTMTVESCRQMMGAQSAYQAGLADPSAARPGDAAMTCSQIMAEIRQQQYASPDQEKLARAQDAGANLQKTMAKQQATIAATAAKEQAELDAARAADRATEMASHGLVQTRAGLAVQERQFQENAVLGDKLAKERAPQEQKLYASSGDFAQDAATQIASNPRLARLMGLANDKHCSE